MAMCNAKKMAYMDTISYAVHWGLNRILKLKFMVKECVTPNEHEGLSISVWDGFESKQMISHGEISAECTAEVQQMENNLYGSARKPFLGINAVGKEFANWSLNYAA